MIMKFLFSVSSTTKRLQLVYNKTNKIDDPKYNILWNFGVTLSSKIGKRKKKK